MEIGIHENIDFDTYLGWDAISRSDIIQLLKSPAHYKHYKETPFEATKDMKIGSYVHAGILTPDELGKYVYMPDFSQSKIDKERKANWVEDHKNNVVLPASVFEDNILENIKISVFDHPLARMWLTRDNAVYESSIIWHDEQFDIDCKCRPDIMFTVDSTAGEYNVIIDLKTTKDASPKGFEKAIKDFNYYIQAAYYTRVLASVSNLPCYFGIIAVEKADPFGCAVYQIDDDYIELGNQKINKALSIYAECRETGKWGGYPQILNKISKPKWLV